MEPTVSLTQGDALIAVDAQRDFLNGGALPQVNAEQVILSLNRAFDIFENAGLLIFITRSLNSPDDPRFQTGGRGWPPHCIVGTRGAEFAPSLRLPATAHLISKVSQQNDGTPLGFQGTELPALLKSTRMRRLFLAGFVKDDALADLVRNGVATGYELFLLQDALTVVAPSGHAAQPLDLKGIEAVFVRTGELAVRIADGERGAA
ncbi:MAG TPA: isochorismatase family protein [Bdellovibrionota bacterium]|nr:isochorismatase family protein [Bdellovibrionota bacterium]